MQTWALRDTGAVIIPVKFVFCRGGRHCNSGKGVAVHIVAEGVAVIAAMNGAAVL